MPTLVEPILSEQVLPGDATADEADGKIGGGTSPGQEQKPLQGGGDSGPERDKETGNEGTGT